MDILVRPAERRDASAIARIYNHYVTSTHATFETEAVPVEAMAQRIAETQAVSLPWLVAGQSGDIVAYACASRWKTRPAYRFAVESSVYVQPMQTRKGFGLRIYTDLVEAIRQLSMHAIIAGVALPNESCIALHERLGFSKVAHFHQVGHKQGRWIDVGYWQLTL